VSAPSARHPPGAGRDWVREAVVYQVYPRSFQDSDGDGVGDLRGIAARLDHVASLGADALWLSPITPSPGADWGYDVSDYTDVEPAFGTLADLDALVEAAHARGLRLLLDLVPCHTSIEHPWFRERPERYVWADGGPPNNWLATFGGPAWDRDRRTGRWYLHSFYPEQPDLDWRNPEVVAAMQDVVRFWLARGVDGLRLDAIDRLLKDPAMRDDPPAARPFPLPLPAGYGSLDHVHSANAPDIGAALAALRAAAGDAALVGEVYQPTSALGPYLEHVDVAFCFELMHCPWDAGRLRAVLTEALARPGMAWVLSNHDFRRLASRWGPANARAGALLLLTLPGAAFLYQGDELGTLDGPGARPPLDRAGRDPYRHPMAWAPGPGAGFSDGRPWLPPAEPPEGSVAEQDADPGSTLAFSRALIRLRRELRGPAELLDGAPGVLALRRGAHLIAVNTAPEDRPSPRLGAVCLLTGPAALCAGRLAPGGGVVARAPGG
jgi:alpha-glucosidase